MEFMAHVSRVAQVSPIFNQPQEIEMKTFYVSIMVQVKDDADIEEMVQEMDYDLVHEDIVDIEMVGVEYEV